VTAWAVDAVLASTLLMAAVLLLRAPVRRLFGPTVAYALWALPALRLLLPPMSEAWRTELSIARAGDVVLLAVAPIRTAGTAAPLVATTDWAGIAMLLWPAGAASFLLFQIVRYLAFTTRVLRDHQPLASVAGVTVVVSPEAPGPLAFGVLRRYVAIPADFHARYDADERALALAHELGHHQRGDLLANWAALAVLAVHWFDPVAWLAFHAFRADQELAVDAWVLVNRPPPERAIYAGAIVKATLGRAVSPACNLHSITNLKRRLIMLARPLISRRRSAIGNFTVATLVGTGLVLTASGVAPGSGARAATMPAPDHSNDMSVQSTAQPSTAAVSAGRQLRTIVVRKDGANDPKLVVRGTTVALRAPLPGGAALPRTFELPKACGSDVIGAPQAFVIKGEGGEQTYTILCTRAASASAAPDAEGPSVERDAYQQALAGLRALRVAVSAEAQPNFPEGERRNVFAAIDGSIVEIEGDLAALQ
jgi:beta-lactamase regulating signal transducer with metallopeptidase domain